jgi:hypothetical protein
MVPSGNMGRRKRDGNHFPQKNKVLLDLKRRKRMPVPDSNNTKINYTKEPNEAHKNTLKE